MTSVNRMKMDTFAVISKHLEKCQKCNELFADVLFHSQTTEDIDQIVKYAHEIQEKE